MKTLSRTLVCLGFVALACFTGCTVRVNTPEPPSTLRVVNSSSRTIYRFYMSRTTLGEWGPDLLGTQVLSVGRTFTLSGIPQGVHDLKIATANNSYYAVASGELLEPGGSYTWTITDSKLRTSTN